MDHTILCRAFDRSPKKSPISRDFGGQIHGKINRFAGVFKANLAENQSIKKGRFCGYFLEANPFRADQTSVFNVFLTEVIICSFNNNTLQNLKPMAKPLTSWLVPSFSQHNLRLVVLGHCLHVSVTKFQDKFTSLRQLNNPNSWEICCTNM